MASTTSTTAASVARRLWDVCEPIAGSVYFAPEVQQRYEALGLSYPEGYFWSRSAAMGTLTPSAVSATFAVFNPDIVRPLLSAAQAKADRETVLEARRRGMGEALRRMLGDVDVRPAADALRPVAEAGEPHGRPLYAGLRDLPWPDDAHQALFFACDLVREYRSDGHVAVWTSLGWHPIEVMALTELFWGMSIGTHMRTRVWPHERVGARVAMLARDRPTRYWGSASRRRRATRCAWCWRSTASTSTGWCATVSGCAGPRSGRRRRPATSPG